MKIVVAGLDNYRSTNSLGIQAMSDGLINKVDGLFRDAELTLHYKTLIFSSRDWKWLKAIDSWGIFRRVTVSFYYRKFRTQQSGRVEDIKNADMLIVSGDGIIADIFSGWGLTLAFEIITALKYNIPCYVLNQSINVTERTILGYVVKEYFSRCSIAVREPISARLLKNTFGFKQVPVAIDSAFFVKGLENWEVIQFERMLAQFRNDYQFSDYIIVGIRGKRPAEQPISVLCWIDVIKELVRQNPQKKIVFASSCPKEDIQLAKEIQLRIPEVVVIEELIDSGKYNYRFLMYLLEHAFFVVSDRYHQLILSMLVGTPVIAIEGNTSKTAGLFEMLGGSMRLLPLLTADTMKEYNDAILHASGSYSQLLEYLPRKDQIRELDRYKDILRS